VIAEHGTSACCIITDIMNINVYDSKGCNWLKNN